MRDDLIFTAARADFYFEMLTNKEMHRYHHLHNVYFFPDLPMKRLIGRIICVITKIGVLFRLTDEEIHQEHHAEAYKQRVR